MVPSLLHHWLFLLYRIIPIIIEACWIILHLYKTITWPHVLPPATVSFLCFLCCKNPWKGSLYFFCSYSFLNLHQSGFQLHHTTEMTLVKVNKTVYRWSLFCSHLILPLSNIWCSWLHPPLWNTFCLWYPRLCSLLALLPSGSAFSVSSSSQPLKVGCLRAHVLEFLTPWIISSNSKPLFHPGTCRACDRLIS